MASSASKKVIYAALVGNSLIAITKFIAAYFTRSSAMFSEGVHSLVDTGNQALLLLGLRRAKRPADAQYPFGHGKEVYFWSFIVAILIFAVGAGVSIYEGVRHILDPHPVANPTVNYIVLALAMVFEGVAWFMAWREFARLKGQRGYIEAVHGGKDPTVFVVLFEDSAAMLGLMVAFVGILIGHVTGNGIYDGIASVVIGLILAAASVWLAYETKSLLIGESASPEMIKGIRDLSKTTPKLKYINEVVTMHMGPDFVLLNLSVDFVEDASADDVEATVTELEGRIKETYPRVKRIFIEAQSRSASRASRETASGDGSHHPA